MNECTYMFYTPKELSKQLNVSKETLRLWHKEGKLRATTTNGGHRRYCIDDRIQPKEPSKRSIVYARVSSSKQQGDLDNQVKALKEAYPEYEVIQDIGSGLNFQRKGF
jgi:excisionase family DNA binding protein